MKPVWIIDDDRSIRWVLEKALEREKILFKSFASADEALVERSAVLGTKLTARLNTIRHRCPSIVDVRGPGSMVAAEWVDPATRAPSADLARTVQQAALARGLLLLTCGQHGNVIRFLYPLTIPDTQFDQALSILDESVAQATAIRAAA